MKAAVLVAPGQFDIRELPKPRIEPDEVLVRVIACGICGTDLRIYRHGHKKLELPAVIGHEVVGQVEEVESRVPAHQIDYKQGTLVMVSPGIPCGRCDNCLRGETGEILARCSEGYGGFSRQIDSARGEAEVSLFLRATKRIVKDILESAGVGAAAVQGIAISAMAPDATAVDARGRVLMPCILWMDRRAVSEAEQARRKIGEERIFALSGNLIDPYYGLIKTLWIKNNLPNIYRRAEKILSLKDYLVGWCTGRLITDVSHASLFGIAYDIRRNRWDEEVLRELELDPAKLPDPLAGDEIAGVLAAEGASELGLNRGTPVAQGYERHQGAVESERLPDQRQPGLRGDGVGMVAEPVLPRLGHHRGNGRYRCEIRRGSRRGKDFER
jgi:hypothetical protein